MSALNGDGYAECVICGALVFAAEGMPRISGGSNYLARVTPEEFMHLRRQTSLSDMVAHSLCGPEKWDRD